MNKNILSTLALSTALTLASGTPTASLSQELPTLGNRATERPTLKLSGSG